MRLVLDTHTFLWFVEGSARLSAKARDHIEDSDNEILLSIASLWEMAIKISLRRLDAPHPFADFIQSQLELSSIQLLEIRPQHTYAIANLPFYHRDPFDRLLAAQCLSEGLILISSDGVFEKYGVERLW
ncbi:MAG: type II toxin-antitoxin system VapC family toxin [Planctomycetes bacterium]|nr:type II toxin-antitoxin system VapC family toxin [Planctomycetota bacterium]MBI3834656.1 type II toxin-antitoxin system VapC family toxin [Planctomycetota bacterium]